MDRDHLLNLYNQTRTTSLDLCQPLKSEDYRIQTMNDVSPPWWNLGHTSWFFAKNILEPFGRYREDDSKLEYVLNSYYESLGPRLPRHQRGQATRPTTEEIFDFRQSVDERMEQLIQEIDRASLSRLAFLTTTGIHHEQQHQELLVTEVKHILGSNSSELREPYQPPCPAASSGSLGATFVPFEGGLHEFGNVEGGWCWDNELPVHKAYLEDYALLNRLVTNGEYLEFMNDGGYSNPLLWLSNGWAQVQAQGWQCPLYWEEVDGAWWIWTLGGLQELDLHEPVCHVSFYEADAYARWKSATGGDWKGARLPSERQWEQAARHVRFGAASSNFLDSQKFHPRTPAPEDNGSLVQMAGDLWEWTSNHYEPYPGYEPFDGNLMEYNGKFMDNQRVLRGGSCATPASHIRVSYRNFWPPDTRFQFTGIRLMKPLHQTGAG